MVRTELRLYWLPCASAASRRPSGLVVEPTEHGQRDDLSALAAGRTNTRNRHPLLQPLMCS